MIRLCDQNSPRTSSLQDRLKYDSLDQAVGVEQDEIARFDRVSDVLVRSVRKWPEKQHVLGKLDELARPALPQQARRVTRTRLMHGPLHEVDMRAGGCHELPVECSVQNGVNATQYFSRIARAFVLCSKRYLQHGSDEG